MIPAVTSRAFVAVVATTCISLGLAACGSSGGSDGGERTADAYCRSFYEQAAPLREDFVEAGESTDTDLLGSLVTLLGAPGELAQIFDGMIEHAPDDIKADTEEVRDAFQEQSDSMGDAVDDPLGALGSGLVNAFSSSDAFEAVGSYLNENCPVDSDLAQEYIQASS